MAYYQVDKTVDTRDSHSLLIIPPLSVILVSCFLFVLLQPHHAMNTSPASSSSNTPTSSKPQPALALSQNEALPLIDPVVVIDHANGSPSSISTATPQPTVATSNNLQAANTNNQAPNTPINVPTTPKSNSKSNESTLKKVTNTVKKTTSSKNHR